MSNPRRRRSRALGELTSARAIIAELGGNQFVAELTSTPKKRRKTQHVTNWKTGGRLPADTFLILTEALAKLGYRASPKLWGITSVERE